MSEQRVPKVWLPDIASHASLAPHSVTEFVPLLDIPYILLSPNGGPYLSIDKFLASPDRYLNPSAFIPDASHF